MESHEYIFKQQWEVEAPSLMQASIAAMCSWLQKLSCQNDNISWPFLLRSTLTFFLYSPPRYSLGHAGEQGE